MPKLSTLPSRKRTRNFVFLICGYGMLLFMLALLVSKFVDPNLNHYEVLIVEWACLTLFGFAWIVKGQQIFADIHPVPGTASSQQNLTTGLPGNPQEIQQKLS